MNINSVDSTIKLKAESHSHILFGTAVDEQSSGKQLLLSMYDSVQTSIFVVDVLEDGDFCYVALNPTHERWVGIRTEDLRGKKPEDILNAVDAAKVRQHYAECVRLGNTISYEQCLQFQGVPTWWSTTLTPLRDANSRIYRLIGTSSNITPAKQVAHAQEIQAERDQVLATLSQKIHESLDLGVILHQTAKDLRQCLNCDRILIYQMQTSTDGVVMTEAIVSPELSLLGKNFRDPCLGVQHPEHSGRCCLQIVPDIYANGVNSCQQKFLAALPARAHLVTPILLRQNIWGLLIAQYCYEPHQWQQIEIDLLEQLATQLGIAVQQSELQNQLKQLKNQLESQKKEHQAQLRQIQKFQDLVRRMTEKIRDTKDETQILVDVTQELANLLQLESCYIEIYNPDCTEVIVVYEYAFEHSIYQGLTRKPPELSEIYQPLLQKQHFQSVEIVPGWHPKLLVITQLACPIFDEQGMLGNLWLIRPIQQMFNELEISLVQTLANECAIAMRQTRLHATRQATIKKLEEKERHTKQFLKNLSHELRTPITSISLAAQTLESLLLPDGTLDEVVPQLLQILHHECGRESKLIHDLLTLIHLEAEPETPTLITIDLQTWLPPIVESFSDLSSCQGQTLNLNIETALPPLATDIIELERILTELLSYTCKYTPPGETITVSAQTTVEALQISISNSGLEIPSHERSRIFEPFYHICKNDPWKYSGTGLEMALVKKMVRHLGGSIHVESAACQTTFIVKFPKFAKL
ncbi:PAS domain S-box [Nostoc sp. PCC 7524]|uniref:GAF domain-containing protein n=1 Tax=Nostoc sp. (strain ATCC 29411 / PCC 7524) TaxID=28072 RepID=UPI00029F1976|nr:GAF domain-containing protein [Nostoc sp. PCC 7524]AFY48557.1 PAS domain S-box [Nostoc sp. PCC 7524]